MNIILRGANHNEGDHQHKTPLIAAIFYKNLEILHHFREEVYNSRMHELFKLVDVDKKNILHFSILSKDNLIIKSVLEWLRPHRAILTFLRRGKDYKGNTPYHLACQLGRLEELTEEFVALHSSQDLLMVNELDQTPFHVAAKSGSLRMLKCLHARDQEKEDIFLINKNDIDQCTPLHLAAMNMVIFHQKKYIFQIFFSRNPTLWNTFCLLGPILSLSTATVRILCAVQPRNKFFPVL